MNILLYLCLFFLSSNDIDKYKEAYNYLNKCENLKKFDKKICKKVSSRHFPINVVSEIHPMSVIFMFEKEVIEQNIIPNVTAHKPTDINEFCLNFDRDNDFEPFESKELAQLFEHNEKSQLYIVFSKPVNNLLTIELAFNIRNGEVKGRNDLTRFNNVLFVLFVFDDNNKIVDVKKTIMHCD